MRGLGIFGGGVVWAMAAAAAPDTVVHAGRLLGADGAPLDGQQTVVFELVDSTNAVRWTESHTVTFEGGYYAVQLGSSTAIPRGALAEDLDVVVRIGSTTLGRQPLQAVPHALSVDGLVRVSAQPVTCTGNAGTLRWVTDHLEVCDGTSWAPIAAGSGSSSFTAAGGTITTAGGYVVHTFDSNGTFTVGAYNGTVEVELMGGGGGGGTGNGDWGAGGGGGGYVKAQVGVVANQAYNINVGGKGFGQTACNNSSTGTAGGTSTFGAALSAVGGGGGGQPGEGGSAGGYSTPGAAAVLTAGNGLAGNSQAGDFNGYGGRNGAGTIHGNGAAGVSNGNPGTHATGNGNGGAGGHSCQAPHRGGGDGSPGFVVVRYLD
jgi:hypothetical protein